MSKWRYDRVLSSDVFGARLKWSSPLAPQPFSRMRAQCLAGLWRSGITLEPGDVGGVTDGDMHGPAQEPDVTVGTHGRLMFSVHATADSL